MEGLKWAIIFGIGVLKVAGKRFIMLGTATAKDFLYVVFVKDHTQRRT